jgi:hypothetical protein
MNPTGINHGRTLSLTSKGIPAAALGPPDLRAFVTSGDRK